MYERFRMTGSDVVDFIESDLLEKVEVLVNVDGELYSLDNEGCYFSQDKAVLCLGEKRFTKKV